MNAKYIIIFFLVSLSFPLWAQSFTPCTDCDTITMRHRNYYIDAWYDTCQCYLYEPYDSNHPTSSVYLDSPIEFSGIILAKRLYTSEPLQIKGHTALVDIHAGYHYIRDTIKMPELMRFFFELV